MKDLSPQIVNLLSEEYPINGNVDKLELFLNILKFTDELWFEEHTSDWDLGLIIKTKTYGDFEVEQGFATNFNLYKKDEDELWFEDLEDIDDETNEIIKVLMCIKISDIQTIKVFR